MRACKPKIEPAHTDNTVAWFIPNNHPINHNTPVCPTYTNAGSSSMSDAFLAVVVLVAAFARALLAAALMSPTHLPLLLHEQQTLNAIRDRLDSTTALRHAQPVDELLQ